ncbi:MAG TPA: hypothetical protein VNJ71_01005 [Gemmatimonadales bacterium]|jgi:hypothetical protein|nr:hypothetical protein [Gemmatimonadales bacterium]
MAFTVRRAEFFNTTIPDEPGEGLKLLKLLAERGINLLAFTAVPVGPNRVQLTIFPDDVARLVREAGRAGLRLDGPYAALLVQGDDALGALAGVHAKLAAADVNVYASSGVADGRGGYGYVIYVRGEDFDAALKALEVG